MDYVSQDSIRLVAIGLVSIAAISVGAATIESTVDLGSVEGTAGEEVIDIGPSEGGGLNESLGGNSTVERSQGENDQGIVADLTRCVRPLAAWYGGLLYFGAFGGIVYLFKRWYSLGAAFLGMYAIAPVFFTVYFLSTDCQSTLDEGEGANSVVRQIGNASGQGLISPQVSPVVIAAVFGVALVAVAAVLLRASGDQTVTALDEEDEDDVEQPDIADLAAAAGKAADRLEEHNVDVDNEVYRAWWEMTSLLNVPDPDTSTPGDFAEAAVDLGMDESDVTQLTTLFEEVRYGKRDPEAREERALEVFRSIESGYSDETADDGGNDGR